MKVTLIPVYQRALARVAQERFAPATPWALHLADGAHGAGMVANVSVSGIPVTVRIDLTALPRLYPDDAFARMVAETIERAAQESLAPHRIPPATPEVKGA